MEFTPEKIVRTTGDDGTNLTSRVYSLEAWANLTLMSFGSILIAGALGAPIISVLLVLLYCLYIDDYSLPIGFNIFSLLVSIYIIIDFHKDWLLSSFVKIFLDGEDLNVYLVLTCATIVTHGILLFMGNFLYNACGKNRLVMISVTMFILTASFLFLTYAQKHNIIKLF